MLLTEQARERLKNLIRAYEKNLKAIKSFDPNAIYGVRIMIHNNNFLLAISQIDKDDKISTDIPLYMNKQTYNKLKHSMLDVHDQLIIHFNKKIISLEKP